MLNEPSSSFNDDYVQSRRPEVPIPEESQEEDALYSEIRAVVETIMAVEREDFSISNPQMPEDIFLLPETSRLLMSFVGRLRMDSETAYTRLDMFFAQHNLLPVFRQNEQGQHVIHVIQGRTQPVTTNSGMWLSAILFFLTVLSVLFVGADMAINEIAADDLPRAQQIAQNGLAEIWRGYPYAISILLILGAHELGHYFLARRHRTAASLPYFLPFPFGIFGTFGAAIRLREPMRNRKVLFDIGAAGPLVGLVFAIPVVIIGLATSKVDIISGGYLEGNSFMYALAKVLVFGRFLPDGHMDVYVNQIAWAGWTGLLVTGLNLIPVGQLDGGHVLYSLIGRRAKKLYLPLVGGLIALALLAANQLIVFVLLIVLMGNRNAVPLDDVTPLDPQRRMLAVLTLFIFLMVFVPQPLTLAPAPEGGMPIQGDSVLLPVVMITLWMAARRRRLH